MKKSNLLKSLKTVLLVVLLGLGVSYVVWAAGSNPPPGDNFGWVSGTLPAPYNNGDDVVNVGSTWQDKPGGLIVNQFHTGGLATFNEGVVASALANSSATSNNRPICVDRDGNITLCP